MYLTHSKKNYKIGGIDLFLIYGIINNIIIKSKMLIVKQQCHYGAFLLQEGVSMGTHPHIDIVIGCVELELCL